MTDLATKRPEGGMSEPSRPPHRRNIWLFVVGVMVLATLGGVGVALTTGDPGQPGQVAADGLGLGLVGADRRGQDRPQLGVGGEDPRQRLVLAQRAAQVRDGEVEGVAAGIADGLQRPRPHPMGRLPQHQRQEQPEDQPQDEPAQAGMPALGLLRVLRSLRQGRVLAVVSHSSV